MQTHEHTAQSCVIRMGVSYRITHIERGNGVLGVVVLWPPLSPTLSVSIKVNADLLN